MEEKKIKVQMIRSASGSTVRQRKTLLGLGLKKLNNPRLLNDTPAIRGMIAKVAHIVSVEAAN